MTNEQLATLVQSTGNKELTALLWDRVYRLSYKICQRLYAQCKGAFEAHGITLEDFESEAFTAFLASVKAYKPESGLAFTSYLRLPLMSIRDVMLFKTHKYDVLNTAPYSLEASIDNTDENNEDISLVHILPDGAPTPDIVLQRSSMQAIIHTAVDRLCENEKDVIIKHYFEDLSLAEIARRQHVSRQFVSELKIRALNKLRSDKILIQLYNDLYSE